MKLYFSSYSFIRNAVYFPIPSRAPILLFNRWFSINCFHSLLGICDLVFIYLLWLCIQWLRLLNTYLDTFVYDLIFAQNSIWSIEFAEWIDQPNVRVLFTFQLIWFPYSLHSWAVCVLGLCSLWRLKFSQECFCKFWKCADNFSAEIKQKSLLNIHNNDWYCYIFEVQYSFYDLYI